MYTNIIKQSYNDLNIYLKCPKSIMKILPRGRMIKQISKLIIKFKIPFTTKSKVFNNKGNQICVEKMFHSSLSEQSKS